MARKKAGREAGEGESAGKSRKGRKGGEEPEEEVKPEDVFDLEDLPEGRMRGKINGAEAPHEDAAVPEPVQVVAEEVCGLGRIEIPTEVLNGRAEKAENAAENLISRVMLDSALALEDLPKGEFDGPVSGALREFFGEKVNTVPLEFVSRYAKEIRVLIRRRIQPKAASCVIKLVLPPETAEQFFNRGGVQTQLVKAELFGADGRRFPVHVTGLALGPAPEPEKKPEPKRFSNGFRRP